MKYILLCLCCVTLSSFAQKLDLQAKKQVVIGSGGGFSGAIKEYILLENGYLYQRELPKDTTFQIRVLYRSTAKKYFTKLTQLSLKRRKFDNPGNVYYYVEQYDSPKQKYRVTWGSATPPKDVKAFYDDFIRNLIPKKK